MAESIIKNNYVEDVTSEFTKTESLVTIYAYRYGKIIEVIVNGNNVNMNANTEYRIATYSDKVKPIMLDITEPSGTNTPSMRGIRIKPDGLYLVNNSDSRAQYVQGRLMYITE